MNPGFRKLFEPYPAPIRPDSALEPLGNAGGLSGARLYRFHSGLGKLVARRWPLDGPDLGGLIQIHAWIKRAGDLGFLPVPIPTTDGRTLVDWDGGFWEVAPWMAGVADPSRPPSSARLKATFGALSTFLYRLATDGTEGPSPGLIHRVEEIERLRHGEFEAIRTRAKEAPSDPASPLALLWLDRAIPRAAGIAETTRKAASRLYPLQPCLRDARPDHFLFEGDRLTGLVDFGAMGRDTVVGDLARLMGEGVGTDREARKLALSAFEEIRPLAADELKAFEAFLAANALLGAARWARWHFLERRTFDDSSAVVRGLERGLERLQESG